MRFVQLASYLLPRLVMVFFFAMRFLPSLRTSEEQRFGDERIVRDGRVRPTLQLIFDITKSTAWSTSSNTVPRYTWYEGIGLRTSRP